MKLFASQNKCSTPTNISHCERAHGQMRVDLHSSGPVRSFVASANRSLCKDLKAVHLGRGGVDPARSVLPLTNPRELASGQEKGHRSSSERRNKHSCNSYLRLLNMKMHVYKLLHAPHHALSDDERVIVRQDAQQEWDRIRELSLIPI